MGKGIGGHNLGADVNQLLDQLERHCLAPDGSLVSKSAYYDLQLAREEMCKERQRYLESLAIYIEAIAMVEEYQQAVSAANFSGIRDIQTIYPQLGLKNSPQVYEALEHRMVVAEAAQKLRLPLISQDGQIHEEEIEKWSTMSRSSLDSTGTGVIVSSSSNSTNYTNASVVGNGAIALSSANVSDVAEAEVGGVPNRYLGITPAYLWQTQLPQMPLSTDVAEYQLSVAREIGFRLDTKSEKLTDAVVIGDIDSPASSPNSNSRLPERVKLIIEEIEREETAWREDLYSSDRKFGEYYNVLEQILGMLIKLVKEIKLQHQYKYDELHKTWLCKRRETMSAKLRKFLVDSTEEASLAYRAEPEYTDGGADLFVKKKSQFFLLLEGADNFLKFFLLLVFPVIFISTGTGTPSSPLVDPPLLAYNKAITRLREYQGVDPHFDSIARQYHEILKAIPKLM